MCEGCVCSHSSAKLYRGCCLSSHQQEYVCGGHVKCEVETLTSECIAVVHVASVHLYLHGVFDDLKGTGALFGKALKSCFLAVCRRCPVYCSRPSAPTA
jgi:hypothetical protein